MLKPYRKFRLIQMHFAYANPSPLLYWLKMAACGGNVQGRDPTIHMAM